MRYCIFCGVKIPSDAKFCQGCGKEQPESSGANSPEATADETPDPVTGLLASPKAKLIVGVGVFVVMIAVFTGTMILVNAK